jgi:hypothetical protein
MSHSGILLQNRFTRQQHTEAHLPSGLEGPLPTDPKPTFPLQVYRPEFEPPSSFRIGNCSSPISLASLGRISLAGEFAENV